MTRATLLDGVIDYAAEHGLTDVSLRQIAAALGTSHRMLIYHFGSKDELLLAVINEMERRQLEQLEEFEADPRVSPADEMRRMWRRLSDPKVWPHERLFFEVYGQALQGRPHATPLLETAVSSWLDPLTAAGQYIGRPRREARALARLGLAVVRGLLLDLLATGDRRGCNDAMEQFIASFPLTATTHRAGAPSRRAPGA